MTRPSEDRRRAYREPPPRYRPSEDPEFRRSPSNQRPTRRYREEREEDDYYYEQQERRPPRQEYPRQEYPRSYDEPRRRPQPVERGYYDAPPQQRRPVRNPAGRPPYESRGRERPPSRPRPVNTSNSNPMQQAKKTTNRKIFSFFYNLIFYTITIGILMTAIMFAFSSNNNASILGYRFYNVLTSSMKPSEDSPPGGFDAGAITIVKMIDGSDAEVGDIVTYVVGDDGNYLTHRLVERIGEMEGKEGNYVITKGDANRSNDPPINEERIMGKVLFAIPKLGIAIEFIRAQFWPCLVCMLSIFGFFIVLKAYLFSDEDVKKTNMKQVQHF
ncbi:signal peptidase I [Enterococcus sp. 669A]|uniref:Signal peptidase I n=1 Tax=Candidatus Enterococcus moelleringii TaxID=2815325 RepID=A0ABS3LDY4_9ENTE|nr:signal peptidase I [Enterococcus sp. 669A]MBO1307835.1 signal peptidase I [Enterococcus sp. 669A]